MADPVVTLTAAPRVKMAVGMNYPIPWNAYGFYFGGGGPDPGTNPLLDLWLPNLTQNLIHLRDVLNVRIVRIFLLGNAFNYGKGAGAAFTPPSVLHPKFNEHLVGMLQAFQDQRMKVIPSIIDFKAFGSKSKGGGGCTDKFNIAKNPADQKVFFDQVVEPFLIASKPFKSQIFAWEVMNEPFWNMSRLSGQFAPQIAGGRTLTEEEMTAFLQGALDLIEKKHGFTGTVGHRFSGDLDDFPTGKARQFHFYSKVLNVPVPGTLDAPVGAQAASFDITFKDRKVPPFSETRAFVGEFASNVDESAPWVELEGADDTSDTRVRVVERLRFLEHKGYPLALVWPDLPGKGPNAVDPLKLSAGAQQGIIDFQTLGAPT